MSTSLTLTCDAPLCDEHLDVAASTRQVGRRIAKRKGWVEAKTNGRPVDFCPSHSNLRGNK